jgi:hypothetical protein
LTSTLPIVRLWPRPKLVPSDQIGCHEPSG